MAGPAPLHLRGPGRSPELEPGLLLPRRRLAACRLDEGRPRSPAPPDPRGPAMRIDRYALTNFGPWGEVVYEPGDARLCIVSGENGTGKSTLVSEALGYALYRDFRGSVNGPVRLGQTDCSV